MAMCVRFLAVLALLAGIQAGGTVLYAADKTPSPAPKVTAIDPPHKVLFVGNSFTYYGDGVGGKFARLARATDQANRKKYKWRSMTISAARLADHVWGLQAINRKPSPTDRLARKWDAVVLQGHSTEPIREKLKGDFQAAAKELDGIIRKNGARTVLFMTWGYDGKKGMTQKLRDAYTAMANRLDALVVPVGLAFELAQKENPRAGLFASDNKHPSPKGSYLAACVFYAAFYGKSPEGISYTAGLDPETARFLQAAAWKTVRAFYGK